MGETDEGRTILRITGADRESFLQGLVTNDVRNLERMTYSALLTPQGKYIADFFLVPAEDAILLDVPAGLSADLAKRLNMYKLRADVAIEQADLYAIRGTETPAPDGAQPDPRHPALGWRLYSETPGDAPTVDWGALRVAHNIPAAGHELTPESYILEAGFERLNGVDFRKGCYVGQEVTARMKHKTELRKGFATVALDGPPPIAGTKVTNADGKEVGELTTVAGNRAIAYLRFDRATGPLMAGETKVTRDS